MRTFDGVALMLISPNGLLVGLFSPSSSIEELNGNVVDDMMGFL
jgi:hypothetical protein